jgi:potassium efflux system protein
VVDARTRGLLHWTVLLVLAVGLWLIWSDIFPALGILKQFTLWSTTARTTEIITVNGESVEQVVEALRPITLNNVALALVVIVLTIVAARNVPGLVEVGIRRAFDLEAGVRYAIMALSTYVIGILGLVLACAAAGVTWSSVQWLAAAMTVGLGFGLQEIFANFVSGLIILFERPMRVGDTVTVGDISGTVSRIRIRATTITDWDRKELVVPNKEFITGRLINWTLSDTVLRLVVRVGIAYGSETETAARLIREAAVEHPIILDDPKPQVLFLGFGNSSLDFELRAFVPGFESYFQTQNDLHMAIDQKFRAAGIVIPFPQRDVHVHTLPPMTASE